MAKDKNRIPAADSDEWRSWAMPVIGDDGRVLNAQNRRTGKQAVETVEDVEVDPLASNKPLTAEQLADIVRDAENEGFERGRKDGYHKGYDEGYLSGQQQGAVDMRQQLVAEQQTFQALAQALIEPVNRQDDKLEALMLHMVSRLSRAVVMRELTTAPADILDLVRQSMAALPAGDDQLTVTLNPEDLAVVEAYAREHGHSWQFHGDPDLTAGGVKVHTKDSDVDYTVERRLDEIIEGFLLQQHVDEETSDEQLLDAVDPSEPTGQSEAPEPGGAQRDD